MIQQPSAANANPITQRHENRSQSSCLQIPDS
jgi:hypothetical protein